MKNEAYFRRRVVAGIILAASAVVCSEVEAQGRIRIEGFAAGQSLAKCPDNSTSAPSDKGGTVCTFSPKTRSAFSTPADEFMIVSEANGEIDAVVAERLDANRAAANATKMLGKPDRTDKHASGTVWMWMRDDDVLTIAAGKTREDSIAVLTTLSPPAARKAAETFADTADECLLDVRDRGISYDKSKFCAVADPQHLAYVNLDRHSLWGNTARAPHHAFVVAKARSVLWSAVAISNAKHGTKRTGLW